MVMVLVMMMKKKTKKFSGSDTVMRYGQIYALIM